MAISAAAIAQLAAGGVMKALENGGISLTGVGISVCSVLQHRKWRNQRHLAAYQRSASWRMTKRRRTRVFAGRAGQMAWHGENIGISNEGEAEWRWRSKNESGSVRKHLRKNAAASA